MNKQTTWNRVSKIISSLKDEVANKLLEKGGRLDFTDKLNLDVDDLAELRKEISDQGYDYSNIIELDTPDVVISYRPSNGLQYAYVLSISAQRESEDYIRVKILCYYENYHKVCWLDLDDCVGESYIFLLCQTKDFLSSK